MWILFVLVMNTNNGAFTTQEFVSERACLEAHDHAIELSTSWHPVRAFCVRDSDQP